MYSYALEQRIPRYKLLLQELMNNTWPSHGDYETIKLAMKKIEQVNEYVNNKKKEAESSRKLIEIQQKLVGCTENMVVEFRKFIMVWGWLLFCLEDGLIAILGTNL